MAALEGAQAGEGTWQLVNDIDIFANRLKFGVFMPTLPFQESVFIQSFKSSIEINKTFGLLPALFENAFEWNGITDQKKKIQQTFFIFKKLKRIKCYFFLLMSGP